MSIFARHGTEPTARIEALAAEIHEVFRETLRLTERLAPEFDVIYAQLPASEKEMCRALARWHLRRVGVLQ